MTYLVPAPNRNRKCAEAFVRANGTKTFEGHFRVWGLGLLKVIFGFRFGGVATDIEAELLNGH
jgi:hypothetical protein